MSSKKIIGGEFDIDLTYLQYRTEKIEDGFYYPSGRSALYNILIYIKNSLSINKIYLPDYLCSSIEYAALSAKFEIEYYSLNPSLQIDLEQLCKKSLNRSAVLLINYFGAIDLTSITESIKSLFPLSCIIQDNVQSYQDMFLESQADFMFTSFRKHFPVPDGGWVKTKYLDLPIYEEMNTFTSLKLMGGILKNIRNFDCIDDSTYLNSLEEGEGLIDVNLEKRMSDISPIIMSHLNFGIIFALRKRNAFYLLDKLKKIGLNSVVKFKENSVPFFIPVRLENRDVIRRKLMDENVFCPIHWPVFNESLKRSAELSVNELSLIVDQRYTLQDMDKIINVLNKYS